MVSSRPGPVETIPMRAPAWHGAVNALDLFPPASFGRNLFGLYAVNLVTHAHRNFFKLIQHIELGHHQPRRAVDHPRVAQQRQVEPPAPPWTSRHRSEFVATFPDVITHRIEDLGRK